MNLGTLYGLGVGPGDPELVTVKTARILGQCRNVFVPKARIAAESVALAIAEKYITPGSKVHELVFPMTSDQGELARKWDESAAQIAAVLEQGEDACFLTLGDPLLFSTYIYLLRALRARLPQVQAVTVPGITAFTAAASLTEFPVGEGKESITIVPTADDLDSVRSALAGGGTVVLMKIGKRLDAILDLLDAEGVIDSGVFVAHASMPNQQVETNLRKLRGLGPEAGYLSIILVKGKTS